MNQPYFIAVCGPTASGKTGLSLELAEHFQTEILSFDSRQFFKELKIGAAPPSPQELRKVRHHFIQQLSIQQEYNAGAFEREAIPWMMHFFKSHSILVGVGGSGMYLDALTKGFDELPSETLAIRKELNQILNTTGIAALQEELLKLDPEYFDKVDQQNPVRLIRALEVIRSTGKPYSAQLGRKKKTRPFTTLKLAINYDRDVLYDRINKRVDLMMEAGLLEEARTLYPHRMHNALQTVGYKELFEHFDGEYDLDFAVDEIKKNSRRYAKRQLTWFRKDPEIKWLEPGNTKGAIEYIRSKYSSART